MRVHHVWTATRGCFTASGHLAQLSRRHHPEREAFWPPLCVFDRCEDSVQLIMVGATLPPSVEATRDDCAKGSLVVVSKSDLFISLDRGVASPRDLRHAIAIYQEPGGSPKHASRSPEMCAIR